MFVLKWWSWRHFTFDWLYDLLSIKITITRVIFMENFRGIRYRSYHAWEKHGRNSIIQSSIMQKYLLMLNLQRKEIHQDLCLGERKTGRVFGQAMIFVLGSISPSNVSAKAPFPTIIGRKGRWKLRMSYKIPNISKYQYDLCLEMDQHGETHIYCLWELFWMPLSVYIIYLFLCFLGASPMSIVSLTLPMSTMLP